MTSPLEGTSTVGWGVPVSGECGVPLDCYGPCAKRQRTGNHSVKKDLRGPGTSNRVE